MSTENSFWKYWSRSKNKKLFAILKEKDYFYHVHPSPKTMMRPLLPLCLLVLLLSSCSSSVNDLERSGLKGNVKSVTEHQYEAEFEEGRWVAGDPSFTGHHITKYDHNGFYLETIVLSQLGDTVGFSICKRENGEMVEEEFVSILDNKTTRSIMEKVSDEQVNFEVWADDRLHYEGANYYDSRGRISRQIRVVNNTELTNYYVYENNLLVENFQEDYRRNRTMIHRYEYLTFDDKGNWTSRLVYVGKERIVPDLMVTREIEYFR